MMSKFGKSCAFGLALILVGILPLSGTGVVEAKKHPRAADWQVEVFSDIFYSLTACSGNCDNNNGDDAIFKGEYSGVQVGVSKSKRKGDLRYSFFWMLSKKNDSYWAHIDTLTLDMPISDPCCQLPQPSECYDPDPPDCMQCFLNGDHPRPTYDFSLQVVTDEDIEDQSHSSEVGGHLWIDMWPRDSQYHYVTCDGGPVSIKRTGGDPDPDQWTISSTLGTDLTCKEYYLESYRGPKWEGWGPGSRPVDVLSAETTPFTFETIWTKL